MKRAALISVIVGAALAIVPAALAAEVADGGGASGIPQTKAVTMAPTSYADAVKTYGSISGGTSTTTPLSQIDPAIRAVLVRNGDARGDSPFVGQTDTLGGTGTSTTTSSDSSSSINWSAVLPAIALGLLLIAMTATFVTRRRHRHQLSV